jgi:flagellar secretion chaperone FliS
MKLPYAAYQNAYQTVSKTRQIVMLYEGAIRFVQQAREAISENRIEDRYNLLMKASDVIIGLQSCLDFDADENVANTLYDFYARIDVRLMQLQRSNDEAECGYIIEELKGMRDVWRQIDENITATEATQAEVTAGNDAAPQKSMLDMPNTVFVSV